MSQKKNATFSLFLYNSVKNNLILILFGRENLENIYYLSTTPEKCHHTTLKIAQLFHLTEVVWFPAKIPQLWQTAGFHVVQNVELNYWKPMSKALLKVTVICVDTAFQSFRILIYYHALLAFSPRLNKELMQLAYMHVSLFKCICSIYQIILWIRRKPTVIFFQ